MIFRNIIIITILSFYSHSAFGHNSRTKPLYIAGLYPDVGSGWTAPLMRVMGDLAVEYIHNTTDILPDYNIIIHWRNSECRPQPAIREFIEFTKNEQVYKGVLGPACSITSGPVAEIAPSYFLNIITYSATSPSLTDAATYPTLTLGISNNMKSVTIWLAIIKYYNWRRIGLLHSQNILFNIVEETLEEKLRELEVETASEDIKYYNDNQQGEYMSDINRGLDMLLEKEKYRIIIGNFYESVARDVICTAYRKGYSYPKITWLLPGWYSPNWYNGTNYLNCTGLEIMNAIQGSIAIDIISSREQLLGENSTTIFSQSPMQIFDRFIQKSNGISRTGLSEYDTRQSFELYTFDSMVTLALALHKLEQRIPGSINSFNYKNISNINVNRQIMEELNKIIQNITFNGISGKVKYRDRFRVDPHGQIFEYVNGDRKLLQILHQIPEDGNIKYYNEFSGFNQNDTSFFNRPAQQPLDGVVLYHLPLWLYIIMLVLMILCTTYVLVIVVAHIKYRKKRAFKLSSPLINALILTGCFIQILAVFPYLIDNYIFNIKPEDGNQWYCTLMCHLRHFLPSIAKDLIFGSLIGKTFRLYLVAVRQSIGNKIQDWKIILFILIIIAVDIAFNIVWGGIPQIRIQYVSNGITLNDAGFGVDENAPYRIVFDCMAGGSTNSAASWVAILYLLFRSVIYIVGIFIAFLVRKVKIRGVNEFTAITYATLVTIMFTFVIIFLSAVIFPWYDVALTLICLSFLADTFLVVSFIFIPKLYFVITDPNEKKHYSNAPIRGSICEETLNNAIKLALQNDIKLLEKYKDDLKKDLSFSGSIDNDLELIKNGFSDSQRSI